MKWAVRELAAEETYALRRAVSADGRTDLPTVRHEMDAGLAPGISALSTPRVGW